jgi:hypothetical protein
MRGLTIQYHIVYFVQKGKKEKTMAKIIEHAVGARRMIRLDSHDIVHIVQVFRDSFRGKTVNHEDITAFLKQQPFYLPEEVA